MKINKQRIYNAFYDVSVTIVALSIVIIFGVGVGTLLAIAFGIVR
jgi:hypothetical protein